MKFQAIAILSGALWVGGASVAQTAAEVDDPVARLALTEYLGTTEAAMIRELTKRTRQDLEAGARRAPAEKRLANVFLKEGATGGKIRRLLEPRGLALARIVSKQPLANMPGQFAHLEFSSKFINRSRDDVGQRVDVAFATWREMEIRTRSRAIMDLASTGRPPSEKELRASIPHLKAYELTVVGSREALLALLDDPAVRAVFVDEDARRVTDFEDELRRLEDQP